MRDAAAMGSQLGRYALRIAVKDAETNARAVAIVRERSVVEALNREQSRLNVLTLQRFNG